MLIKLLPCLLALTTGCIVHAVDKTTVADLGTVMSAPSYGPVGAVAVDAGVSASTMMIHATQPRDCIRKVFHVTEVRTGKQAAVDMTDLGGGGGGGGSSAVAVVYLGVFVVMVFTGVVSGTATAVELAVSHDHVERRAVLTGTMRTDCAVDLSGLTVEVVLPSGETLLGTTDETGTMHVEIPDSEPSQGNATIRVGDKQVAVSYARSVDTRCSAARIAMFDRINREPDRARRAVLVRATPTCTTDEHDDALWDLTKSAALAAIAEQCDAVRRMGQEVQASDRQYFDAVFARHVEIAHCMRAN